MDRSSSTNLKVPTALSRRFLLPLAVVWLACGSSADRVEERANTVTIAFDGPGTMALHPNWSESPQWLVFLPLVDVDENGEWVGRLAESWEASPDWSAWTFHLRPDLRWQDGVPVTAHDVEFTLRLAMHPEVADLPADYFDSIEVVDDHTLIIRSNYFTTGHPILVTVYYPRHLLEGLDPAEIAGWEFWTHPVGNGPYRVVRYLPETMMEFEVNPDYFGTRPRIERLVLKFTGGAAQIDLLAEQVDAAMILEPMDLPRFIADPRFRVHFEILDALAVGIYWNTEHPSLRDARVRRALTMAIDRGSLLAALNLPADLPLVDGPYTPRQIRRDELPEPLPFDRDMAASLLEEAGWRDIDGDGIREKGGEELRISVVTRVYSQDHAILVQSDLKRVGVRLDLELVETAVTLSRLREGDFEALITLVELHPATNVQRVFGTGGWTQYSNPRLDELLAQAVSAGDPAVIDELYAEIYDLFRDEQPATFLFPSIRPWVVHRRLQGLSAPWVADPIVYLDRLWLEE